MATLHASDIADQLILAQSALGKGKLTDLASDLQEHVAISQLFQKKRAVFDSGNTIRFNMLMKGDNNFRNVGLFDVDNVNQADGLITGDVPWRHSNTGYTIDRRQITMGSGSAKLLDIYKEKRYMMLVGQAAGMEENWWEEPASSTDEESPFGVKYWLVYNATEGFNGGNNSNFSSGPAGKSRTTYPRLKNYTFNYTNVSKDDLVRKMRRASALCRFMPTIPNRPIPGYGTGQSKYAYYTTYDVLAGMEELAEAQNDNLGNDVASKDGLVTFRRVDVQWVPYLQANEATADPMVGIDWDVFRVVFLRGEYMRETKAHVAPLQHNVVQGFTDNTYNFLCYDSRKTFLGAKSSWH